MNKIFGMDTAFAHFMNTLANIIWIGLLWLLCSLPVVTAGAASSAAYYAMVHVVQKKRGYATEEFFRGFKTNLKLSIPIWLVILAVFAWLFFDIIYLYGYGTDFAAALSYILYAFVVLLLAIVFYIFPCLQKFDESNFELFKLSFYFSFRHLITTIVQVVLFVLALLGVYFMPWSILLIPGLWWYAESFLVERILKKYSEKDAEEDCEEALEDGLWTEDSEEESTMEEDLEEEDFVEDDSEELSKKKDSGKKLRTFWNRKESVKKEDSEEENTEEEETESLLRDRLIRKK